MRAIAPGEVAEFQGLYGAYHVSERLLQKIWLRGAFDQTRAHTTTGEPVRVLHPGAWNRLSGPDFRGARLRIGDREVTGDVEVHFRAEAWNQHGHASDPAYAKVALHVVLFPPSPTDGAKTPTHEGREIPILALVDLLLHDLEEYATDEAVAALTGRDTLPLVEDLLALEPAARATAVRTAAAARWQEKVHFARLRIDRCGWEEACHLTALEILGYRANREAMLRVATAHPWAAWAGAVARGGAGPDLAALLAAGDDAWTLRGVRPANHPRLRLAQYSRWMARAPDWPRRLRATPLPPVEPGPPDESIASMRRRAGHAGLRARLARDLTGGALGGLRADTFVINLVLPFLATTSEGATEATHAAAAWWRLWTPGDVAETLLTAARQLATPATREPRTNETIQGLLGLHLQRTSRVAATA